MLLKQYMLLICQETHVNLICGSYEISYVQIGLPEISVLHKIGR
jgi:hypothetical protein